MPVAPMFSNRQRADESFRRSQETLMGAIAAIKAAKDEEEQRKRQGLQDTLTQQTIEANQMGLDKSRQESGLVAQMGDQMTPGSAGPALPGDSTMASPFTPAGAAAAGSDFKFSVLSKLRTLRGKEATPEMVKAEYEANRAAADQAQADAVAAPGLRSMELGLKGSQKAHADAETLKTQRQTELLGQEKPATPAQAAKEEQNNFKNVQSLRKEADDNIFLKAIPKVDRYYSNAKTSYDKYKGEKDKGGNPSVQFVDQALVYSFNKTMEETSAVMPGEFERTALGQGVAQKLINSLRSGVTGGLKLSDDDREAMLASMEIFRNGTIEAGRDAYTQLGAEADKIKADRGRVIGSYSKYYEPQGGAAGPKTVGRFQIEVEP